MNWWLINAGIVTVTCLLSEVLCMKLETQEIKLSVDDLIESTKKVKDQIIEVVEKTSARSGIGVAKKKKKKKKSSTTSSRESSVTKRKKEDV